MRRRDPFDFGLLDALSEAGEKLPRRLEIEILAYEEAAVEPLCELLGDANWGELHAVRLIRALGAEPAVDALISVLADSDPMDYVHDEICETLTDLGSRVVEPALDALARAGDGWYRHVLLGVLAYTPAGNATVRAARKRSLLGIRSTAPACSRSTGTRRRWKRSRERSIRFSWCRNRSCSPTGQWSNSWRPSWPWAET